MLPSTVAGRQLAIWSVRGRCWLEMTLTLSDPDIDALVAGTLSDGPTTPIEPDHLAYAVAGRSDVQDDPPYFVFGAARPEDENEIDMVRLLMFGGAGFPDLDQASDLRTYKEATIAGKHVWVGTPQMLRQSEHQRGRPYLYQTDEFMFLIITDDDEWAADAIGQLPS